MAWELKRVEDQRKQLVDLYAEGEMTMTEICRHFGVSRKTAYKWLNRYQILGYSGLQDESRAPHNPCHCFSEAILEQAINLKLQYPTWGPKKVLARLHRDYPRLKWPSATRLYEIFKEENLVHSRRLRKRVPATHPLGHVNQSNDVWMADFKGWFLTEDKSKCEPLTITDGFSRYLIKCEHLSRKTVDSVWPVFATAFEEYGLPNRLRTDNGPPFGCVGVGRLTGLSINLIKAGVKPEWINPGHPEENGRHERFHLTLKEAVASPPARTLQEQVMRMALFQREYNFERPHEALEMNTPASNYRASPRQWDGVLRSPEYDTERMIVRKVGQNGCVWLKHTAHYIGEALKGEYTGLKEREDGSLEVYYGPIYLGQLTVEKGLEKPKMKVKKIIRRG